MNTNSTYKFKSLEWIRFKERCGYSSALELEDLSIFDQRVILVKFIRYLHEHGITAGVINGILAGVQFFMKVHCKDVQVFTDPTIQLARRAVLPSQRSESIRKEKSARYPVTLDMLIWLRDDYYVRGNIDDKMTYLGCVLGFTFMWRVSQYVSDKSEHTIMTEDIRFKINTGEMLESWEMKGIGKNRVECAVFVVRSNKQRGNETQYLHLGRKSVKEIQLLEDIVEWCHLSQVKKGEPFLSRHAYKGKRFTYKRLTRKMVSTALKVVATAFGFESVHFTPHALRIGGATSAKVKGGREFVRETGGWSKKSNNDLIYEHGTPLDDNALAISRTCFSILTSDQVKTMMSVTSKTTEVTIPPKGRRRSALGDRPL